MRPFAFPVGLMGCVLALTSCGVRVSHAEIVATERGSGQQTAAQADTSGASTSGLSRTGSVPGSSTGVLPSSLPGQEGGQVAGRSGGRAAGGSSAPDLSSTATKRPIVIGNIGDYSGVAGASTGPTETGIKAWLSWTNAHGGINGHRVVMYSQDTGGDPAKAQQEAKDLVENRDVLAIVLAAQPFTFTSTKSYYERVNIPVVGADIVLNEEFSSPVTFPQGTDNVSTYAGEDKVLAGLGKKKLALLYCEIAACKQSSDLAAANASRYGLEVVYQAQASLAQPDYTSECLQAQNKGADSLIAFLDANGFSRVVTSCNRQGFHPQYVENGGSTGANTPSTPGTEGLVTVNQIFPFTATGTASQRAFHEAMSKYGSADEVGDPAARAWAAGELFRVAVEHALAANHDELTRAGLFAALNGLRNETADGTTPPLTFAAGQQKRSVNCFFTMTVSKGRWETLNGGRTTCV
jgi:branched-chain amino acid transport system substrate-binding protein